MRRLCGGRSAWRGNPSPVKSVNEVSAVFYGLLSALTWGSGDFSGGLASKRTDVFSVVLISQFFGGLLVLALALVFEPEGLTGQDFALGAAAGICGALGLLAFYQALASGRMGLTAPLASLVSAIVPVLFGLSLEGLPSPKQGLGFLIAFVSVWLISKEGGGKVRAAVRDWLAPLFAGLGFAFFFIIIDQAGDQTVYWPLFGARLASTTFLLASGSLLGRIRPPARGNLRLILLSGVLDVVGNIFFVLAAQTGRLDISVVLSSFYAAVTVFWAWILLREKLASGQWAGVLAAVLAVVLIAS